MCGKAQKAQGQPTRKVRCCNTSWRDASGSRDGQAALLAPAIHAWPAFPRNRRQSRFFRVCISTSSTSSTSKSRPCLSALCRPYTAPHSCTHAHPVTIHLGGHHEGPSASPTELVPVRLLLLPSSPQTPRATKQLSHSFAPNTSSCDSAPDIICQTRGPSTRLRIRQPASIPTPDRPYRF